LPCFIAGYSEGGKMNKNEKTCWNCGSQNMKKLPDHSVCLDCGATWCKVSKPGHDIITIRADLCGRCDEGRQAVSPSPSSLVTRRAAKARGG